MCTYICNRIHLKFKTVNEFAVVPVTIYGSIKFVSVHTKDYKFKYVGYENLQL